MNKPEKLYCKPIDKIEEVLMSVVDEVKEVFHDERSNNEEYITCAKYILLFCITYLKKMNQDQWKTVCVLRYIYLLLTGAREELFLSCIYNVDEMKIISDFEQQKKKIDGNSVYLFATRWILYYYKMFEVGATENDEYDECDTMVTLITLRCLCDDSDETEYALDDDKPLQEGDFILMLKSYLDEYMVGQDNVKKILSVKMVDYVLNNRKSNVLLIIGPTGSGKTYLIDTLERYKFFEEHNVMFFRINASLLTPEGYSGNSITEILSNIERQRISKECKKVVVVFDEIDKIMMPCYSNHDENINANVQADIMNFISGNELSVGNVDTRDYMFILQGAFTRLDEIEEEQKRNIGFKTHNEHNTVFNQTIRENLIKVGVIEEFLGRITTIVRMSKLSKLELKEILINERYGELKKKEEVFESKGKKIIIEDSAIQYIVDSSYEQNLGGRSVKNVVEAIASDELLFDMIEGGFDVMRITKDTLVKGQIPILGKRKKHY